MSEEELNAMEAGAQSLLRGEYSYATYSEIRRARDVVDLVAEMRRLKADIAILQCQVASLSCGMAPHEPAYCVNIMSSAVPNWTGDAAHAATFYDDGFVAPPATPDAPHIAQGE